MKKLLLLLTCFMLLFVSSLVQAKEVKLTFAWSANSEADMGGYALFYRMEGQTYDYNLPIDPTCAIAADDGKCYINLAEKTCEFKYTFNVPDGVISKHYFVARARNTDNKWSEDSNEVSWQIDLAPIVSAVITAAVYNKVTNTIDILFQQADSIRVGKWELFMSNTSGEPYIKVDTIIRTDEGDTFSASWQIPGDGNYYFTLVSFTPEGMFSPDSNQMFVEVKTHPSPVKDFKIKIRIQ